MYQRQIRTKADFDLILRISVLRSWGRKDEELIPRCFSQNCAHPVHRTLSGKSYSLTVIGTQFLWYTRTDERVNDHPNKWRGRTNKALSLSDAMLAQTKRGTEFPPSLV